MHTILPYPLLSEQQHPDTIECRINSCVLVVEVLPTEIQISPQSITNSVSILETLLSPASSQIYRVLQIQNAALIVCHEVTSNARTFKLTIAILTNITISTITDN